MLKTTVNVFCLLTALFLGSLPAMAQARSSSADINGTVLDPAKLPLRGATVSTKNLENGQTRVTTTDNKGVYRIPALPSGLYDVKVEINGFSSQIQKGVTLTVGQSMTLNFEMAIGKIDQAVVVDTDTPQVETDRSFQSSTITQRLINELPIDGRNFLEFSKLTPGVSEESPAIVTTQVPALTTTGLSFSGQNARANSVQVDGVDNNDTSSNGVRPTISQEAVKEFQIDSSGYDAEFGRARAGVINIVSKSGSNQFHGDAYEYFRNEALDARNPFATYLSQDAPFQRNQPGFTLGGPLMKDKAFFFVAYEGLIRRESAFTTILADPTILQPTSGQQDLINTLLASGNSNLVAQGKQLQSMLTTSPNNPSQLNRNIYNLLNSSYGAFPTAETSSTGSFRVDYSLNERDSIFFRYSLTNDSQQNFGIGGQIAPSAGFNIANRDNTFVVGETHVFNNGSTNEFRFQNIRNTYNADTVDPNGPRFEIAGIGSFGRDFTSPTDRTQRQVQFVDNVSLPLGRHNIKFGGNFSRYTIDTISDVFLGGEIDFAQLPIPLAQALGSSASSQLVTALSTPTSAGGLGRPDLVPVITTQSLTTVQQASFGFARSINQGFGNPNAQFTGQTLGVYLQDGVKVLSNLYLSYGLRYDYDMPPTGTPRDPNNVGPRFGFSYDPFKNGKTVIRGGGGVYYQSLFTGLSFIPTVLTNGVISTLLVASDPGVTPIAPNSPCGQIASSTPPSFCFYQALVSQGLLTVPSSGIIPQSAYQSWLGLNSAASTNLLLVQLAPNVVNSYSVQGSLGIERQLGRDFSVSINYLFNRGVKIIRPRQANALPNPSQIDAVGQPALTGRVNPNALADYIYESAGTSTYHGLTVSLNKRFSRHYQVIASYSYSKVIGDADDLNFQLGPQDPTNARADRGLSSFDMRQRLSVAAVMESPFKGGAGSSLVDRILADFYLSPIVTAHSGFPFNIETGTDINLDTNNNDRPFGVGRNTGIGPGFFTTDLRVGRRFNFRSDKPMGLEIIFDAFNLFNRTNFMTVNNITGAPFLSQAVVVSPENPSLNVRLTGLTANTAAQLCGFTSAYPGRVIQLGAKFNF